jgi:hypothetical protein
MRITSVLVSMGVLLAAGTVAADEPKRVYTNEDLARVSPLRSETGVDSTPAQPPPADTAVATARGSARARGGATSEARWRHEAERVRQRVRALHDSADGLRLRIAQQHAAAAAKRDKSGQPHRDQGAALEQRLALVLRQARELEADLEERARRDGALPGWLR